MTSPELPLVSVIIPFYNESGWLVEALDSVVAQQYTAWEAIVIDDGSELVHRNVARNYCMPHPNMKFIHHQNYVNRGVTISRNFGVAASAGTYLAFLDADDKWQPQKLANQVSLFMQFPAAQMICEASEFWYSWNDHNANDRIYQIGVTADALYAPPSLIKQLYPLGHGAPPCPSGIMIRRSAFERAGGFEPAFSGMYTLYEDQAFLAKVYLNETVYISGSANNFYRKRENSMSSAANDLNIYERVRTFYLHWLQSYMRDHKIKDAEIDDLIQRAYQSMQSQD